LVEAKVSPTCYHDRIRPDPVSFDRKEGDALQIIWVDVICARAGVTNRYLPLPGRKALGRRSAYAIPVVQQAEGDSEMTTHTMKTYTKDVLLVVGGLVLTTSLVMVTIDYADYYLVEKLSRVSLPTLSPSSGKKQEETVR
jgi:hypothetical protein